MTFTVYVRNVCTLISVFRWDGNDNNATKNAMHVVLKWKHKNILPLWTETPPRNRDPLDPPPPRNMGPDRKWHHTPPEKNMEPDSEVTSYTPWYWHLVVSTVGMQSTGMQPLVSYLNVLWHKPVCRTLTDDRLWNPMKMMKTDEDDENLHVHVITQTDRFHDSLYCIHKCVWVRSRT